MLQMYKINWQLQPGNLTTLYGNVSCDHIRAVTDSINSLLNICSSTGPGQKECDNALRNIEVCGVTLYVTVCSHQAWFPCHPVCHCVFPSGLVPMSPCMSLCVPIRPGSHVTMYVTVCSHQAWFPCHHVFHCIVCHCIVCHC